MLSCSGRAPAGFNSLSISDILKMGGGLHPASRRAAHHESHDLIQVSVCVCVCLCYFGCSRNFERKKTSPCCVLLAFESVESRESGLRRELSYSCKNDVMLRGGKGDSMKYKDNISCYNATIHAIDAQ
jgi:hypothetical protein